MNRACIVTVAGMFAVCLAMACPAAADQGQLVSAHLSNFGPARASVLDDGTVVMSFDAGGDLRGVVTLTLRAGNNGLFAGEWAFTVAHVDSTDPETGVEPPPEIGPDGEPVHPHRDFVNLVHRGTLAGSVAGAVIVFDATGALVDVQAPLTIGQGTLEFQSVTGSGQATLTGLTLSF
jgi:hypothetical protein